MKRLAIGVGLVELIWHLGSASRRLKKLLGLFIVLCISFVAITSTAGAFTVPPGVYGPYELTFQNVEYGYRWTHVHWVKVLEDDLLFDGVSRWMPVEES